MTQRLETPSQVVARRVREVRRARGGLSAEQLAQRCADLGMPSLNRSVIANLENGRRDFVTVDELLVLALALDVAPLHLVVPMGAQDPMLIAPDIPHLGGPVRAWVRGERPLDDLVDPVAYQRETPGRLWADANDFERRLQELIDAQAEARAAIDAAAEAHDAATDEYIEAVNAGDKARQADREKKRKRAGRALASAGNAVADIAGEIAALRRERDLVEKGY